MTQELALKLLKAGYNVFLTGSAGAGKTYVLNQYIQYLKERKVPVAITASTGIAATHMNGMTIHAWSGIGVKDVLTERDIKSMKTKKYLRDQIQNAKVLIIDEISMLHRSQFDLVNQVTKEIRKSHEAFGGLQVIVSGDFFQLPPVGEPNERNRDKFAFMSGSWVEANFKICYLTEQYRQSDNALNQILNKIRSNEIDSQVLEVLRAAESTEFPEHWEPTKLFTHNVDVDRINQEELEKLDTKPRKFRSATKGNEKVIETLKKSVQASELVELKVGAKVMFVKNNPEAGYINGTLGMVTDFSENGFPIVRLFRGNKELVVKQETWSVEDEKGKTIASYSQLPLRLAWAITVHKSQGMTLDSAEIDLSRTFETGQGYVALSRLKDLEGLRLSGFNEVALKVDPLALKADNRFLELTEEATQGLDEEWMEKEAKKFIERSGGITDEKEVTKQRKKLEGKAKKKSTYELTKELVDKKCTIAEIAEERGMSEGTIMTHLLKIKEMYPKVSLEMYKPDKTTLEKVSKVYQAILKSHKGESTVSLKPIFEKLNGSVSYHKIKQCLIFLD